VAHPKIALLKDLITIADFPSGVIMSVHTLIMIGISVAAFILNRPIDGSILGFYGLVLGSFAGNKTLRALKTPSEAKPNENL
jgi:hypothetical protein